LKVTFIVKNDKTRRAVPLQGFLFQLVLCGAEHAEH